MNHQERSISQEITRAEPFKEGAMKFTCPAQVLVIDRIDGPADVLADLIARLYEGKISSVQANNYEDAVYALNCAEFNLVILGIEANELDQLAVMPDLRDEFPDLPVMVVGRNLSRYDLERCRYYHINDAVEMPRRAAELKALVVNVMDRYLQCMA